MQFKLPNFWPGIRPRVQRWSCIPSSSLHLFIFVLLLAMVCPGCSESSTSTGTAIKSGGQSAAGGSPIIVVTSQPLLEVTQKLVGHCAEVVGVLPDDPSAAQWALDQAEISQLQSADGVVLNGAGHEPWLPQVTLSRSRLVDTSAGLEDQIIRIERAIAHQHGPKGALSGQEMVPSVWLDPRLMIIQIAAARERLMELCPDDSLAISEKASEITTQLDAIDTRLIALCEQLQQTNRSLIIGDPALMYLTRRLAGDAPAIDVTAEQAELIADLRYLQDSEAESDSHFVLVSADGYQLLRGLLQDKSAFPKLTLIELDDCRTPSPDDTSVIARMTENLDRLEMSLLPD